MEGRARAAKQSLDVAVAQAWHTEAFARTKKLKRLAEYLKDSRAQTAEEILAAFRTFQGMGAAMAIEQVN